MGYLCRYHSPWHTYLPPIYTISKWPAEDRKVTRTTGPLLQDTQYFTSLTANSHKHFLHKPVSRGAGKING